VTSKPHWTHHLTGLGTNGLPGTEVAVSHSHLSSPDYSYTNDLNQLSPTHGLGVRPAAPPVAQLNLNGTARLNRFGHLGPETAVQAFFHYFYNSHPFCLPEPRLLEVFKERHAPLLEYAVQFIGSSYIPSVPTAMYKEALDRHINNGNYPRDAWSVQALLLFGIGLHAHNEVPRAAQVFTIAQNLKRLYKRRKRLAAGRKLAPNMVEHVHRQRHDDGRKPRRTIQTKRCGNRCPATM
jgi:hypothetical protein